MHFSVKQSRTIFQKMIFIIILSALALCESAFVDTLYQCSKDDGKCQAKFIQDILPRIGKSGIPELDIPPIDPVELKNLDISVPNVVQIVIDGVAKGVKNCAVNKFTLNVDDGIAMVDLTCDITLKVKYKVSSSSSVSKNLFGGMIHGDGNGKVKIEKLNLKLEIPFYVVRRGEDIFLHGKRDKITYTFDVLGKVLFAADNLYLGDKESSETVVKLLNENWKLIVTSYGNNFVKIAIDLIYKFIGKFFTKVPVTYYIKEDLSSYVKN